MTPPGMLIYGKHTSRSITYTLSRRLAYEKPYLMRGKPNTLERLVRSTIPQGKHTLIQCIPTKNTDTIFTIHIKMPPRKWKGQFKDYGVMICSQKNVPHWMRKRYINWRKQAEMLTTTPYTSLFEPGYSYRDFVWLFVNQRWHAKYHGIEYFICGGYKLTHQG